MTGLAHFLREGVGRDLKKRLFHHSRRVDTQTQVGGLLLETDWGARWSREDCGVAADLYSTARAANACGPHASTPATRPRIRLAYHLTPRRIIGDGRAEGIEFTLSDTDEVRRFDAGLLLTSIGYRGKAIRDLPFDDAMAVVPNDGGRVVDPRTGSPVRAGYVAGWIKRGPMVAADWPPLRAHPRRRSASACWRDCDGSRSPERSRVIRHEVWRQGSKPEP